MHALHTHAKLNPPRLQKKKLNNKSKIKLKSKQKRQLT